MGRYNAFARERWHLSESQCREAFARENRMNEHDLDAELRAERSRRNDYYDKMDRGDE